VTPEIFDEAVTETLHRLLGGDEVAYRCVRRVKDQSGMPEYLRLVAGGGLLEIGPAFHLLGLRKGNAGIGLLQHKQPDRFDVASGTAERLSRRLHGRDHFWIGWSEEARRCQPADAQRTVRRRVHAGIEVARAD